MAVALIVAAGSGERLGASLPKALVPVQGRPMLQWSIDALRRVPAIEEIVVSLPPGASAPQGVTGVRGGAVRSESVRLALAAAGPGDPVLVHDAARPLLTPQLAERVLAALTEDAGPDAAVDAAIAAAPVSDTIKRADPGGRVLETLDRSALWAVQTPQVFRRRALEQALAAGSEELVRATDDAWLVERLGGTVAVVESDDHNFKVTTQRDLRLAELVLGERSAGSADPD
ncbi:MAG TPA: 2-C-methyl-D-erythritol 4-phosphate cytidylyltransferase [Solirubrobacteraceae bacterium]|nr:2-C-methyl-D-erythritol 4-phosphate cytidylyltransferase [Solirubrobacteraceae bacterium]